MLYRMVELEDGVEVQYLGVYALRWQDSWGQPQVGFVEAGADLSELKSKYDALLEQHRALQELLAERDAEIEELRERLGEWQKRASRNQGGTIRLLREKAELEDKLVRAHRMLVDDLDVLYPDVDTPVRELKAKLLGELQGYLEE